MITAVIVSYYTGSVLFDCIKSLKSNPHITSIIIVDNGNPEGFLQEIQGAHIITGHGNIGFAKGCNLGVKNASTEYVLIINPDCILSENFQFGEMLYDLKNHHILCATCKIENLDGTEQRGSRRKLLTTKNIFLGINLNKKPLPKQKTYIEATSGAFMLFKREDYITLGGFDEEYFLHVEDLDMCMKIKQIGGKIIYYPNQYVRHVGATSNTTKEFIERHKLNGFRYYFFKFFGKNLLTITILYLLKIRFALKKHCT